MNLEELRAELGARAAADVFRVAVIEKSKAEKPEMATIDLPPLIFRHNQCLEQMKKDLRPTFQARGGVMIPTPKPKDVAS